MLCARAFDQDAHQLLQQAFQHNFPGYRLRSLHHGGEIQRLRVQHAGACVMRYSMAGSLGH